MGQLYNIADAVNFDYSTFKIQESTFFVFFCGEPCPITLPVRTDKAKNDSSS